MMSTADVPSDLAAYREELQRLVDADLAAAAVYVEKVLELRQSAALGQATLAGIDRAVAAYQSASVERLVPRRTTILAVGEDD